MTPSFGNCSPANSRGSETAGFGGQQQGLRSVAQQGASAMGFTARIGFFSGGQGDQSPGYRQVDTSLFKEFHVWREHMVGFRADFFNVFNIASYGNPDNNVNDANFGQISDVRSPPRQIQLGLHYSF